MNDSAKKTNLSDTPSHRSQPSLHLLLKKTRTSMKLFSPDFWFHTTIHLVLLPCGYGCFSAVDGPEAEGLTILMSVRSFMCLIDDSIVQDMSRFMCPMHHTTSVSASLSVKPPDNFNKTLNHAPWNWKLNLKHCNLQKCSLYMSRVCRNIQSKYVKSLLILSFLFSTMSTRPVPTL